MSDEKRGIGYGIDALWAGLGFFFVLIGIGGCNYLNGKSGDNVPLISITVDKEAK